MSHESSVAADPATGSSGPEESPEPRQLSAGQRAWQFALRTPAVWTFGVLVVLVVFFSVSTDGAFATWANAKNMLVDGSLLLVIAVGMTMVIITSGIDLSVGAVTIFASVAAAKAMEGVGGDSLSTMLVGLAVAIASGLGWGLISGALVTVAKIVPLIATLATLGMATGLALVWSDGVNSANVPLPLITGVGNGDLFGIPWLVIIAVIVAAIGALYLGRTRNGLYLYAIGSNEDAPRRSGVRIRRHLTSVYAITGALAGLVGFLALSRFGTTELAGHTTDNLQAISAAVLGGTSLFGGRGTILGTTFGVFIPVVLANGLIISGLQPYWQQFAVGVVLALAVYADQVRRSKAERS